jgi:hypothetical protein
MGALEDALDLSRRGDVDAAIRVLRDVTSKGEAHWSLLWQLAPDLDVANAGCGLAKTPIAQSTWALRRGLLHLEHKRKKEALADLQLVLKLRASDDHQTQARAALLQVAALR